MRFIDLRNSKGDTIQQARVDDNDYEWLVGYPWYAGDRYPQFVDKTDASGKHLTRLMHVFIWTRHFGPPAKGFVIDHRDRSGFDNQKANLRLATLAQNRWNSKAGRDCKSGYKGVHLDARRGTYQAMIRINGKLEHIGCYHDPIDAACAYDHCAEKVHKDFAGLNNVEVNPHVIREVWENKRLMSAIQKHIEATNL